MLVFGCFHLFLGLLNVCELVVRKLRFTKCFKNLMLSAHPTAPLPNTLLEYAAFLPKRSPTSQTVSILDEEAQLVARRVTNDEISRCNSGRGFLDEEQPQDDAHSGNKWLCKAEMETRIGVRLTSAMLDNGQHEEHALFCHKRGTKIFVCTRDQILLTRQLGSTDTGLKLPSGTDCDNPLATEATCSRCRC